MMLEHACKGTTCYMGADLLIGRVIWCFCPMPSSPTGVEPALTQPAGSSAGFTMPHGGHGRSWHGWSLQKYGFSQASVCLTSHNLKQPQLPLHTFFNTKNLGWNGHATWDHGHHYVRHAVVATSAN